MCQLIESRSYGDLYGNVTAWGNALRFMLDTLKLPVRRVAVATLPSGQWFITGPQYVDSPNVYFEDADGCELGCFISGVSRLQVFAQQRRVHETMRADRTLWQFTPNARNQGLAPQGEHHA